LKDLFNHPADASGLAFWHSYLASLLPVNVNTQFLIGQFIGFVLNGATGPDAATLTNKVTVAAFTTTTFADHGITSFTPTSPPGQASIVEIQSFQAAPAQELPFRSQLHPL
jgi:hypothetical protein